MNAHIVLFAANDTLVTSISGGNMSAQVIDWNRPMLTRFKRTYKAAVSAQQDTFTFDNHAFVVGYAKYLIEYLERMFPA